MVCLISWINVDIAVDSKLNQTKLKMIETSHQASGS